MSREQTAQLFASRAIRLLGASNGASPLRVGRAVRANLTRLLCMDQLMIQKKLPSAASRDDSSLVNVTKVSSLL